MTFDYLAFASRGYLQKTKTNEKQISHPSFSHPCSLLS